MKRILFALVGASLMLTAAGCCCHRSQCNPCTTPGYGGTYGAAQPMSYAPVAYATPDCNCTY